MIPPAADSEPAAPRAWWLLAVRVVVIALAAGAALYALRGVERAPVAALYRCPMHPEVVAADAAAECPICGMALVQDDGPARVSHAAPRTGRVERRTLTELVRAPAWVDANGEVVATLYRDDLVGLAPAQVAQFFAASAPGEASDVALTGEAQPWDAATAQVRFERANEAGGAPAAPRSADDRRAPRTVEDRIDPAKPRAVPPAPGSHGSLVIAALPRELLVVPAGAILEAAEGPYVLVVSAKRIVKRTVAIGRDHHGVIAVLGGLSEGEDVVIGDAFFVAAEQLLHPEGAP